MIINDPNAVTVDSQSLNILNSQGVANNRNRDLQGALPTIKFGGADSACTIAADPGNGMMFKDPRGFEFEGSSLRILKGENDVDVPTLGFGPTLECSIFADPAEGLFFKDPRGFVFEGGQMIVNGEPIGGQGTVSSRRFKENIRTMSDALDK